VITKKWLVIQEKMTQGRGSGISQPSGHMVGYDRKCKREEVRVGKRETERKWMESMEVG